MEYDTDTFANFIHHTDWLWLENGHSGIRQFYPNVLLSHIFCVYRDKNQTKTIKNMFMLKFMIVRYHKSFTEVIRIHKRPGLELKLKIPRMCYDFLKCKFFRTLDNTLKFHLKLIWDNFTVPQINILIYSPTLRITDTYLTVSKMIF